MSNKFDYDESGDTTLFFLITVLSIYVVSATLSRLFSSKKTAAVKIQTEECSCNQCAIKRASETKASASWKRFLPSLSNTIYVLAIIALAFLYYRSQQVKQEAVYDPYEVLGLGSGADTKEIKKKYRELSLQYHPDKNTDNPDAEAVFIRISKAYQALTDDATRENWEKYGNPDGPTATTMGIALPSWLVDKSNHKYVLAAYVAFMLVFVITVAVWWRRSQSYVADKVLVDTLQFYLAALYQTENATPRLLIEFLSCAAEFVVQNRFHSSQQTLLPKLWLSTRLIDSDLDGLKEVDLFSRGLVAGKARLMIHAQQHRRNPELEIPTGLMNDFNAVIARVPQLVGAMLDMMQQAEAIHNMEVVKYEQQTGPARGPRPRVPRYFNTFRHLTTLGPLVVQGLKRPEEELKQVPHYDPRLKTAMAKKRADDLESLLLLDDAVLQEVCAHLTATQVKDVFLFRNSFPFLQVSAEVYVKGTKAADKTRLTEGAMITCAVRLVRHDAASWRAHRRELEAAKAAAAPAPATAAAAAAGSKNEGGRGKGKGKGKGKGRATEEKEEEKEEEKAGPAEASAQPAEAAEKADHAAAAAEPSDDKGTDNAEEEEEEIPQKGENDETDYSTHNTHEAHCSFFPTRKFEGWWVVLADPTAGSLVTPIRYVSNLETETKVNLEFIAPEMGHRSVTLFVISDVYVGRTYEQIIRMKIGEREKVQEIVRELDEDDMEAVENSSDEDTTDSEQSDDSNAVDDK